MLDFVIDDGVDPLTLLVHVLEKLLPMRLHLLVNHLGHACVDQILELCLQWFWVVSEHIVVGTLRRLQIRLLLRWPVVDLAVRIWYLLGLLQSKSCGLSPCFWRHLPRGQVGLIDVVPIVTWAVLDSLEVHFLA